MISSWNQLLDSCQHLAAIADSDREGVSSLEELLELWTSVLGVHENGLGPTITSAKNVSIGEASTSSNANEIIK